MRTIFSSWHMFSRWRWQFTLLNLIYSCQLKGEVSKLVHPEQAAWLQSAPPAPPYHSNHYHVASLRLVSHRGGCLHPPGVRRNSLTPNQGMERKQDSERTKLLWIATFAPKNSFLFWCRLFKLHDQWPWNISHNAKCVMNQSHSFDMRLITNTRPYPFNKLQESLYYCFLHRWIE